MVLTKGILTVVLSVRREYPYRLHGLKSAPKTFSLYDVPEGNTCIQNTQSYADVRAHLSSFGSSVL